MLLLFFLIPLYLLSCSSHQENDKCLKYSDHTKHYCLMQNVKDIKFPEIIEYCSQLGEWEEECRYDWMRAHKKTYSKDDLLSVCQSASDCLFEVIDFYAEPILQDQLEFCRQIHLQHYQEDCQRFALQRAFTKGFSKEDILTFQKLYQQRPRLTVIDHFAGILQECTDYFTCSPSCTRSVNRVQHRGCPRKRMPKPWVWSENKADPVQHRD